MYAEERASFPVLAGLYKDGGPLWKGNDWAFWQRLPAEWAINHYRDWLQGLPTPDTTATAAAAPRQPRQAVEF